MQSSEKLKKLLISLLCFTTVISNCYQEILYPLAIQEKYLARFFAKASYTITNNIIENKAQIKTYIPYKYVCNLTYQIIFEHLSRNLPISKIIKNYFHTTNNPENNFEDFFRTNQQLNANELNTLGFNSIQVVSVYSLLINTFWNLLTLSDNTNTYDIGKIKNISNLLTASFKNAQQNPQIYLKALGYLASSLLISVIIQKIIYSNNLPFLKNSLLKKIFTLNANIFAITIIKQNIIDKITNKNNKDYENELMDKLYYATGVLSPFAIDYFLLIITLYNKIENRIILLPLFQTISNFFIATIIHTLEKTKFAKSTKYNLCELQNKYPIIKEAFLKRGDYTPSQQYDMLKQQDYSPTCLSSQTLYKNNYQYDTLIVATVAALLGIIKLFNKDLISGTMLGATGLATLASYNIR